MKQLKKFMKPFAKNFKKFPVKAVFLIAVVIGIAFIIMNLGPPMLAESVAPVVVDTEEKEEPKEEVEESEEENKTEDTKEEMTLYNPTEVQNCPGIREQDPAYVRSFLFYTMYRKPIHFIETQDP